MPLTEATYERVALEDREGGWELYSGRLRSRSSGTSGHNEAVIDLGYAIMRQIDHSAVDVRVNTGRLRWREDPYHVSYLVPDVFVFPHTFSARWEDDPYALEVYNDPVPFVADVWEAPETGYDVEHKMGIYRQRGDAEIWLTHPFERWVSVWHRRADGSYEHARHTGGIVPLHALRGVQIDLDLLLE